eukprot:TRINITY_DN1870_c0_g1_i2.p1 TRINITY_DN1870_c0_g1~~TRINITY_DN1870_c0_g1_i2.p1  ORF type:complete len:355 (+),score=59.77 TRINITY_DN1870_c0_g1_i2:219-1283(+)
MKPVQGPSVWIGKKLQKDPDSWVYTLTKEDKDELKYAISQVHKVFHHGSELNIAHITKSQFELPSLGPKLESIQNEIVNGKGFVLIRSIPVGEYGRLDSMIAFWGIGLYLGQAVSQNKNGHVLGHVLDLGNDPSLPTTRLYTTNKAQRFHVDSSDIVGLLCLQKSMEGGLSSICSSATVYNEILEKRPDLLKELVSDFYWDRKGETPEGKLPYWKQPIFNFFGGKMLGFYDRNFLTTTARHSGVPPLTESQIEAIDLMEGLCGSDDFRLDMVLEPGDCQFVHNHQIFHARTAFIDYAERERKRHLVRLWLSAQNGWSLPPIFSERYGPNIEVEQKRGGIICPGTEECAPIDPWA